MPEGLTHEHAKALYDLALAAQRAGNTVHAVRILQTLVQIGDPFYTPFALYVLSQCYFVLGQHGLTMDVFKRATQLPREQQLLLPPEWLALCYQRWGELGVAREIQHEVMTLAPNDPSAIAAVAELSLMQGDLGEAETWARKLRVRGEPKYLILGRVIEAFVLALNNKHDESAAELSWVGQFIISSGSVPVGQWDYADVHPLLVKLGSNSRAAALLLDVLSSRKALPDFIEAWQKLAPAA